MENAPPVFESYMPRFPPGEALGSPSTPKNWIFRQPFRGVEVAEVAEVAEGPPEAVGVQSPDVQLPVDAEGARPPLRYSSKRNRNACRASTDLCNNRSCYLHARNQSIHIL